MKFFLKQTIYLLPIILMGVSFLSVIFDLNFVVWGNIGGFSLVTDVLFFYVFYYGTYCVLTKMLPLGMFIINILNIFGFYHPEYYPQWYEVIVFSLILTAVLIYEAKRHISK